MVIILHPDSDDCVQPQVYFSDTCHRAECARTALIASDALAAGV